MVALILLFLENVAGMYVFDMLANACANYRHELEEIVRTEQAKPKPQKPASGSNVKVVEGPNSTKEVYIEVGVSFGFETNLSGEYFDYSAYKQHIIFWTNIENSFTMARDIHRMMTETMICIFCVIFLGIGLEKLLGRNPILQSS